MHFGARASAQAGSLGPQPPVHARPLTLRAALPPRILTGLPEAPAPRFSP
eukprot:CAMPEP_0170410144 /NCGR_PEP_ID=MMETSP0117_2-20130122/29724_1 /TAXON_ID=400756 /ORGANISM="Durinskia baltica, Strain CSIRO CS-38" /LENGTH=49 /DNA_ID=CAMNT_0010667639 /DNA_START=1 /DNA_END=150 /DNA_ORIENTATION=+